MRTRVYQITRTDVCFTFFFFFKKDSQITQRIRFYPRIITCRRRRRSDGHYDDWFVRREVRCPRALPHYYYTVTEVDVRYITL